MNFESLLKMFGGEDGTLNPDKILQRRNAPPPIQLTPSQEAGSEFMQGFMGNISGGDFGKWHSEEQMRKQMAKITGQPYYPKSYTPPNFALNTGGAHSSPSPAGGDMVTSPDSGGKNNLLGGILSKANKSIQSSINAPRASMESMGMGAGMMVQPNRNRAPMRAFARGGHLRQGETGIVGEGGNGDPTDDELIYARPDGGVDITPLHEGIPEGEQYLSRPLVSSDARPTQQINTSSPTASMSGKITDPNNVFYTPPQPVRDQQPAEYYPNGIRKRAMDERDPSGERIGGGQSSDIERSTWNPDYNPAYDQSRGKTSATNEPANPYSGVPSPEVSPTPRVDDPLNAAYNDVVAAQQVKPLSKWAMFGDAASGALQGANNFFNNVNNPIVPYSEMKRERKLRPALQKLGLERDKAKFEGQRAREAAQIDDFGRKKDAEKRISENQIRDDRNAILKGLYGTGFNSKQPTKAQLLALQSVGLKPEDVGDVRQTNPRTGVVGGIQFEQDAITGEWKDSGRPHDPTEAFVSMQVNDADGNDMGTFTVSQKNKAQFVTQLVSAGYQTKKAEYNEIREIKRRNADKRTKYEQELRDYDAQLKTSQGAIQAAEDALIELDTTITALNGEIAGTLDEDAKKTLRSNLNTLQTSKRNQQKEIAKLKGTKIARPVKPSYEDENVNMPSNSGMVGSGKTTEAAAREHYKNKGLSPKDIDAAIQRARDAGEVY